MTELPNDKGPSALLLRIPLELRVEIFRYAVQLPNPIRPTQLAPRSNKFYRGEQFTRPIGQQNKKELLAVTQLSLTCSQIYNELAAFPVFYEVNDFMFTCPHNLLAFLVALTPTRRAQIRSIIMKAMIAHAVTSSSLGAWAPTHTRHVLAMLSLCKSLRLFRWECDQPEPFLHLGLGTDRFVSILLDACHDVTGVLDLPLDSTNYFSLPVFSLVLFPGRPCSLDLTVPVSKKPSTFGPEVTAHMWSLVARTIGYVVERKRLLKELAQNDSGVLQSITQQEIKEAIQTARIDFPGEDRVHLDRFNNTIGSVSSRTRRQCNNRVTSDGVIDRNPTTKYTTTGLLIRPFYAVKDVRWASDEGSDQSIECNMYLGLKNGWEELEHSWEPLDAIACKSGLRQLGLHYKHLSATILTHGNWQDLGAAEELLARMERTPPPKKIFPHMQQVLEEENAKTRGATTKAWARLQKKWEDSSERFLARLEKEREIKRQVEEYEKERAKQAGLDRAKGGGAKRNNTGTAKRGGMANRGGAARGGTVNRGGSGGSGGRSPRISTIFGVAAMYW